MTYLCTILLNHFSFSNVDSKVELNIGDNKLTGTIVTEIGMLVHLCEFYLSVILLLDWTVCSLFSNLLSIK